MSTDARPKVEDSSRKEEDLIDLRMQRIQEYLVQSLSNANPLRANLGGEAGNLMRMGLRLEQAIDKSLARSTDVLQQAKGLSAAMEIYLKITRQWDRLLQLDNRIADGEGRGRRR
jgi:hypothetical protein